MPFNADLHIHSKYSIATAKNLDLENIYIAAQLKGLTVVGTGDFTHPGWFAEIEKQLVAAEPGLFRLNDESAMQCDKRVPPKCRRSVRFVLTAEISNIYKKNNKTRKNHNLILVPDLAAAKSFSRRLERIGNIHSDGRPILGLDARDMLEILLEVSASSFLIPAHIWTPWFSMLGSKSGFDSVDECFGDLSPHIFAAETGLSSDPAMNWRVKGLDGLTLVSNSDAHSPMKLGREANRLDAPLSFSGIRDALESGDPQRFLGTFEYYPEEGKYHLDGHRRCNVRYWPSETIACKGVCPVCGKGLTRGVLYRVEELADRPSAERPNRWHPYVNLIPLVDILGEVLKKGTNTKAVQTAYHQVVATLGPELEILAEMRSEAIEAAGVPLLAEAVRRMRTNRIHLHPGYDGEFGTIDIFAPGERQKLAGQKRLFSFPSPAPSHREKPSPGRPPASEVLGQKPPSPDTGRGSIAPRPVPAEAKQTLNPAQRKAVEHPFGALMIVAGPGTGKTRTLTERIAYLIRQRGVDARQILAVTFTQKAAREIVERLLQRLGPDHPRPFATTFHSLCLELLSRQRPEHPFLVADDTERVRILSDAIRAAAGETPIGLSAERLAEAIATLKQQLLGPGEAHRNLPDSSQAQQVAAVYRHYQERLRLQRCYDFEDLLFEAVRRLEADPTLRQAYRDQYPHILVDEYQDLNHAQYRLIKLLTTQGSDLCVIGDPNQAIYAFRGSDPRFFDSFSRDFPGATIVHLDRNYRSSRTILTASSQVIALNRPTGEATATYSTIEGAPTVTVIKSLSEKSEAVAIGKLIERLVGGTGFHAVDFDKVDPGSEEHDFSFKDVAVLYRTHRQGAILQESFDTAGIPYQVVSKQNLAADKSIGALLALLKLTARSGSFADIERVAALWGAGIGRKTIETFRAWSIAKGFDPPTALQMVRRFPVEGMQRAQQSKLDAFIADVQLLATAVENLTTAARLEYLTAQTPLRKTIDAAPRHQHRALHRRLIAEAETFGRQTHAFLNAVALQRDSDLYDPRREAVAMMTLHTAKGLEFPVVVVSGCEDGFLPYRHGDDSTVDIEEEARLFYVAMTRAMERLYLSWAARRRVYGKTRQRALSPFVAAIEAHLLSRHQAGARTEKAKGPTQLELF